MSLDDLTLGQISARLRALVAHAATADRPRPTRINPPGHPWRGHEWVVVPEHADARRSRGFWSVVALDNDDLADAVYVHTPDSLLGTYGDYICVSTLDARRLAAALLAAADRADFLAGGGADLAPRKGGSR